MSSLPGSLWTVLSQPIATYIRMKTNYTKAILIGCHNIYQNKWYSLSRKGKNFFAIIIPFLNTWTFLLALRCILKLFFFQSKLKSYVAFLSSIKSLRFLKKSIFNFVYNNPTV